MFSVDTEFLLIPLLRATTLPKIKTHTELNNFRCRYSNRSTVKYW